MCSPAKPLAVIIAVIAVGCVGSLVRLKSSAAPPVVHAQTAAFHVLKIAAGPSGTESNGVFVLSEERSIFNRSDDREVIVYFQWDGQAGAHKFVGHWRSPDGGATSMSTIEYVAKDRRFGAYWRLTISPSMPLGTWSIEATVDGQPAGRFTFEVTDRKVAPVVTRRPLSQAELYERLNRMFIVLHRSTAAGRELESAAGFMGARGQIYTSMAAIDDVDQIRAVLPGGVSHTLTALLGWNRRQDWVVLQGPAEATAESLSVAAANSTQVGDRCFSMEGSLSGGRALLDGGVTGKGAQGTDAPPLLVTFVNGSGTPGAPVVNEFGELVGLVGGGTPGATRQFDIMRFRAQLKGVPVIPLALARLRPDSPPAAMADLRARGELLAALWGDQHVQSGGFARGITKAPTAPAEQRDDFSIRDKGFFVFVTWNPQERLRGQTRIRVHNDENRIVVESKPKKTDIRKRDLALSSWEIPMLSPPGVCIGQKC